jgi:hypothetical protein
MRWFQCSPRHFPLRQELKLQEPVHLRTLLAAVKDWHQSWNGLLLCDCRFNRLCSGGVAVHVQMYWSSFLWLPHQWSHHHQRFLPFSQQARTRPCALCEDPCRANVHAVPRTGRRLDSILKSLGWEPTGAQTRKECALIAQGHQRRSYDSASNE